MIALAAAATMMTTGDATQVRRIQLRESRMNAVVRELIEGYRPGAEQRKNRADALVRMDDRDARQIDTNALLQRMLTDRGLASRILFYPGEGESRRRTPFVVQSLEEKSDGGQIRVRPERERPDARKTAGEDERESERASIGRFATLAPPRGDRERIVIAPLGPPTTASSIDAYRSGRVTALQRGMARMEAGSDVAARWTTPTDTLAARRTPGIGGLSDMAVRRLEALRGDSIMSADRDLSRFGAPPMGSMRRGLSEMRRMDYSGQNFGRGPSRFETSSSLSRFSSGLR